MQAVILAGGLGTRLRPLTNHVPTPSCSAWAASRSIWAARRYGPTSRPATASATASYDAFNLWTLVSAFSQGAHGLARFQAQDYVPRLGWLLLNARRLRQAPDAMVLVLALTFLAELVLPTRTLSRYFIFPMVFAVAALAGSGRHWPVLAVILALTTTSLVGSYGSMAIVLDSFPEHAPALDPHTNPLSALMMHLFRSDAFITAAGLLNLASLLTMAAVLVLERRSPQVRSREAASPRFETRRGLATPPMIPFRGHPDLP